MTTPTPTLETARLLLRPIELADAPGIQAVFPQWKVVEFLGPAIPWPYPADGADSFVRHMVLPGVAAGQMWVWSIRLRDDPDRLIGVINLRLSADKNRGFWLDPDFHGRGLMREAADAVTGFWFDTLGRDVMRIPKAIANAASRAISVRDGARVVWRGPKDYVSGTHESELWELTAAEWRARHR